MLCPNRYATSARPVPTARNFQSANPASGSAPMTIIVTGADRADVMDIDKPERRRILEEHRERVQAL